MMKVLALSLLLTAVWGCDQDLTDPSGVVTSPNYPNLYPNSADCTSTITVEEGKYVLLQFKDFETEKIGKNCYDYVEIFDGSDSLGQFCGRNNPGTFISSGNIMRVRFISDRSRSYRGFSADYSTIDNNSTLPTSPPGSCGGFYYGDTGSVTSPNYPGNYPSNSDCEYFVSLETGGKMKLTFDDFEVEGTGACRYDYLEVRDESPDGKLLGRFCGSGPSGVQASGDKIYMKFVSDGSLNFKGFKATWGKLTCEALGGSCNDTCSFGEFTEIGCDNGQKCCKPDVGLPENCGIRPNVTSKPQIVGGQPAVPNSWPWQASLQRGDFHYCGASLISRQWAISAAHCTDGERVVDVVLGEHNRRVPSGNERRVRAEKYINHENFINSSPWPNDISLIKFNEIVEFNEYYSPICLPESTDQDFAGENTGCYLTGWGDTKGPQDRYILQEIQLDPITNEECRGAWGSSILDTHICIGRGGKGSCQGDSGGPCACPKDGVYYLAGATSWGIRGCAVVGYPPVYTRISSYLSWIGDKMATNS